MGTRWRVFRRILNENVFSSRALDNFTPLLQAKGSLICVILTFACSIMLYYFIETIQASWHILIAVVSVDLIYEVHGLLKQLYSASLSKNPVNIAEWVFITVANIISNLTCSKSLFEYTTKEGREMKQSLKELIKLHGMGNIADFFPLFKLFDPQGLKRRTLAIFQKYDALYEKLIDERLKEREIGINNTTKKEKGDMLDALLNYRSERPRLQSTAIWVWEKDLSFLHAFEWECPSGVVDNMEEFVGTTIQKAKSIIAIPKPRLSTSVYL
ncbi:hypothetical protein TB2_047194 [Malus domestica]